MKQVQGASSNLVPSPSTIRHIRAITPSIFKDEPPILPSLTEIRSHIQ